MPTTSETYAGARTCVSVASCALHGIHAATVRVEVELRTGMPSFAAIGLPDAPGARLGQVVRAALSAQDFRVPAMRIVVNVTGGHRSAPHTQYDLATALAILAASGQIAPALLDGMVCAGELSASGKILPVAGVFVMAEHARQTRSRGMIVAEDDGPQARAAGTRSVSPGR